MELPIEILYHILEYIPPSSSIFAVSKIFRDIANELYRPKFKHLLNSIRNNRIYIFNRVIKDRDIDPSDHNNVALLEACNVGNVLMISRLIEDHRVDPCCHDGLPLYKACSNGNIHIVTRLLQDPRVDPTINQYWALQQAIYTINMLDSLHNKDLLNNHIQIFILLLKDKRMNQVFERCQILEYTEIFYNQTIIKIILEDPRINLDIAYPKVLNNAIRHRDMSFIKELLDKCPNISWDKVLQYACIYSSVPIVEYMIYTYHIDPFDYPKIFMDIHILLNFPIIKLLLQYPSKNPNRLIILKSTIQIPEYRNALSQYFKISSSYQYIIQLIESYI